MIGSCDNCDRQRVPVMHGSFCGCETTQCYVCNGDVEDPYGELDEAGDSAEVIVERKLDSIIRETRERPMAERLELMLTELNEYVTFALHPETVDLIEAHKPMVGQALTRCQLIMNILLAQQPGKLRMVHGH